MSFFERLEQMAQSPSLWVSAGSATGAGMWWAIRKIMLLDASSKELERRWDKWEKHVDSKLNDRQQHVDTRLKEMHIDLREIRAAIIEGNKK